MHREGESGHEVVVGSRAKSTVAISSLFIGPDFVVEQLADQCLCGLIGSESDPAGRDESLESANEIPLADSDRPVAELSFGSIDELYGHDGSEVVGFLAEHVEHRSADAGSVDVDDGRSTDSSLDVGHDGSDSLHDRRIGRLERYGFEVANEKQRLPSLTSWLEPWLDDTEGGGVVFLSDVDSDHRSHGSRSSSKAASMSSLRKG